MVKLCAFDLDGTTFDTLPDLMPAFNAGLISHGYPPASREKFGTYLGSGFENAILRMLPPDFSDDAVFEDICRIFTEIYARSYADNTYPYPGMKETLLRLSEHGIKLALLSNKTDSRCVDICAKLLPEVKFDVVRGARTNVPLKPDPTSLLEICSVLGVRAEECVYVGDSDVDIFTAHNAGMPGIGCAWGYRGRDELENAGADYVIERPEELFDIVAGG